MEERLTRLETRIAELSATVGRLEERIAALEGRPLAEASTAGTAAQPDAFTPPSVAVPSAGMATQVLSLVGRSFLVLGGAYLIRALTEGGSIPRPAGVFVGLAYAIGSAALAEKSGKRGETLSASFHGFLAVLIAYPLLWEASTRMEVFSPLASAVCLLVVTALLVAVAWRQNLAAFAWAAVLAAAGSGLGLLLATHSLVTFASTLLLMGGGTLWLTYGRKWHGLRWPAALAADLAVVIMVLIASWPKGLPENYRGLSIPAVLVISIGLVAIYPGSFAIRIVARHRSVNVFEIAQTILALLAGFGGAVRVARSVGSGAPALGAAALLAAAGCYGVALVFAEKRAEWSRNFHFFTSLALVLTLFTASLVAGGGLAPVIWSSLALTGAILAVRLRRITLRTHSAVYSIVAAFGSGLLIHAVDAFLLPADKPWSPLGTPALLCLGLTIASYVVLAAKRDPELSFAARLPDFGLALLSAAGIGGVAVLAITSMLRTTTGALDPGSLAVTRTAILAAAAFLLAGACQRTGIAEFGWISYLLLIVGGLKLVIEDMQLGSSATRFPAFILYGAALIVVPRLLRQSAKTEAPGPGQNAG